MNVKSDQLKRQRRTHSLRVKYDYDGATGAWFQFNGTAWEFAKVLFTILRNHRIYHMEIEGVRPLPRKEPQP